MATQPNQPDPFQSIGGGVYYQGGWKPRAMYSADELSAYDNGGDPVSGGAPAGQGTSPAGPAAPPAPPAAGPTAPAPAPQGAVDPFASLGGGTPTANGGWLPPGMTLPTGGQTLPTAAQTPAGAIPGQTPTTPGTPTGQPQAPLATNPSQIQSPFYSALAGLLTRNNNVTGDDPVIKDQVNAARSEEERNFAKTRAMMAERAASEGTSMTGGFDNALLQNRSDIGSRLGKLSAGLVADERTNRMAQLMTALSIGQGVMSDSDKNLLQRELADLEAQLKREGYGVQEKQIQAGQEESAADRALRQLLAGQSNELEYAKLGQQNTQFGQNLSANLGMHDEDLAQALTIALLNPGG